MTYSRAVPVHRGVPKANGVPLTFPQEMRRNRTAPRAEWARGCAVSAHSLRAPGGIRAVLFLAGGRSLARLGMRLVGAGACRRLGIGGRRGRLAAPASGEPVLLRGAA